MEAIRKIEELFTVDTAKLKAITTHFISELTKGMCCTGTSQHHKVPPTRANHILRPHQGGWQHCKRISIDIQ